MRLPYLPALNSNREIEISIDYLHVLPRFWQLTQPDPSCLFLPLTRNHSTCFLASRSYRKTGEKAMMDSLTRLRTFPPAPAPNDHPEEITGNVSLDEKRLNANILAYHVAHSPESKVFANSAIQGLKLAEINVRERSQVEAGGKVMEAETICEITVEEGENKHYVLFQEQTF